MKKTKKILVGLLAVASISMLVGCAENGADGKDGVNGKSAYELYCDAYPDYTGTLEEWLESLKVEDGQDGVGIEKVKYTENGDLLITFTDGTTQTVEMPEKEIHTHEWKQSVVIKDAGCETDGLIVYICECGEDKSEILPQKGHTEVIDEAVEPTCTETGLTEGKHCSVCGEVLLAQEEIGAKGHTEVIDQAVKVTCTQSGLTEGKHCSACGEVLLAQEEIPTGHKYGDDNICTICGEEYLKPSEGLEYSLNAGGQSYSVTGIGSCTDTEIVIPSVYKELPVTSIGEDAFRRCYSLTEVVIPNSVTSIGWRAFGECYSLMEIVIPDSVTSISDYAFSYCSSLTEIVIPENVTSIGDYAFEDCSSLTEIVIPDSVTSIGEYAFYGCSSLTEIVIPESVTTISYLALAGCGSLTEISVDKDNAVYQSIDGNLYSKDGKTLIQYAIGKTATSFTIPDDVTSIGCHVFAHCSSLTEVVIPNSVTSIGDWAFYDCDSLTNVVIGDSVTSIDNYAFSDCDSLTEIVIPDSVTTIGWVAFKGCSSLTIYCEAESEPSGWEENWNGLDWDGNEYPVVWGYKSAEAE